MKYSFKVEVIVIDKNACETIEVSKTFNYLINAYHSYLDEIEKRLRKEKSFIAIYKLFDDGSQEEYIHCEF